MTNYQIEGFTKWLILITILFTVTIIAFSIGWAVRDGQYEKELAYAYTQRQILLPPVSNSSVFIIPEPPALPTETPTENNH